MRDLMRSLIEREKITTTETKAKALRPKIEKIITKGKQKNIANLRYFSSKFGPGLAKKICEIISPRYQNRKGGYIRIIKRTPRKSDHSSMEMIELVK